MRLNGMTLMKKNLNKAVDNILYSASNHAYTYRWSEYYQDTINLYE